MGNGRKVLYIRLFKAFCDCMESKMLWYDLYYNTLKSQGVVVNPYDRYIANSPIDGKQCTIAWYVDYNKVSHIVEHVSTRIVKAILENLGELMLFRGGSTSFW